MYDFDFEMLRIFATQKFFQNLCNKTSHHPLTKNIYCLFMPFSDRTPHNFDIASSIEKWEICHWVVLRSAILWFYINMSSIPSSKSDITMMYYEYLVSAFSCCLCELLQIQWMKPLLCNKCLLFTFLYPVCSLFTLCHKQLLFLP